MKEFNEQNIDDDSINSDQNEINSNLISEKNLQNSHSKDVPIVRRQRKSLNQMNKINKMSQEEYQLFLFKKRESHRKQMIKEGYEEYKAKRREKAKICWQNKSEEDKRIRRKQEYDNHLKNYIKKKQQEDPNQVYDPKQRSISKLKENEVIQIKQGKLNEDFTEEDKKLLKLKRKRDIELQDHIQKQDISKLKAANYNQSHLKQKVYDKTKSRKENKTINEITYNI